MPISLRPPNTTTSFEFFTATIILGRLDGYRTCVICRNSGVISSCVGWVNWPVGASSVCPSTKCNGGADSRDPDRAK